MSKVNPLMSCPTIAPLYIFQNAYSKGLAEPDPLLLRFFVKSKATLYFGGKLNLASLASQIKLAV